MQPMEPTRNYPTELHAMLELAGDGTVAGYGRGPFD